MGLEENVCVFPLNVYIFPRKQDILEIEITEICHTEGRFLWEI